VPAGQTFTDPARYGVIRARLLCFAVALGLSAFLAAEELRVLVIKSRPAVEMIPLVKPLLAPGDYINANGYQLIVRTAPANFRQIEQLLAQIDKAPRMLTVTVRQATLAESQALRQSVSGSIKAGDARVTVKGGTSGARGGATVIGRDGSGDSVVRYEGQQENLRSQGKHNQMVRVLEGQRAFVQMGQAVVLGVPGYGSAPGAFYERTLTNGFDVLPRMQGEQVTVEILPHMNTLQNPRTGEANIREAGTTVRARLGEWMEIGEIREQENTRNRSLASGSSRQGSESWRVLIKVD